MPVSRRRGTGSSTDTAVLREGVGEFDRFGVPEMEAWLTARMHNPGFKLPRGYEVKNGVVQHRGEPFINTVAKIAPYVGMGLAGGIGATAYGAGSGAASAGAAAAGTGGPSAAAGAGTAAAAGAAGNMGIAEILKLIVPSATSLIGGMMAGDPTQRRDSFKGTAVDPVKLLTEYMKQLDGMGDVMTKRLNKPQNLTKGSIAQSLPGFAIDPAATDPSILNGAGLDIPEGMFSGKMSSGTGTPRPGPGEPVRRRAVEEPTVEVPQEASPTEGPTHDDQTGQQMQALIDFMIQNRRKTTSEVA